MTAATDPGPIPAPRCPVCGGAFLDVVASAEEIAEQVERRREFFSSRIEGKLGPELEIDLIRTARSEPAPLLRCDCGTLMRGESPDCSVFREAHYAAEALDTLHREHYEYFSTHEVLRRLRPGMRVLEIGSYVGGFLRAAIAVGATATGIDVCPDVTRFTSDHGLPTICGDFMDVPLERGAWDAVFLWSCFEQLRNPSAALDRAGELLRPGGLIAIRVPDADWYVRALDRQRIDARWGRHDSDATKAIGYSNLSGFPHLFGFGEITLKRCLRSKGFSLLSIDRTAPFRPGCDRMQRWAIEEERSIAATFGYAWMEITARMRG